MIPPRSQLQQRADDLTKRYGHEYAIQLIEQAIAAHDHPADRALLAELRQRERSAAAGAA